MHQPRNKPVPDEEADVPESARRALCAHLARKCLSTVHGLLRQFVRYSLYFELSFLGLGFLVL